jgi:hypothetical protein
MKEDESKLSKKISKNKIPAHRQKIKVKKSKINFKSKCLTPIKKQF